MNKETFFKLVRYIVKPVQEEIKAETPIKLEDRYIVQQYNVFSTRYCHINVIRDVFKGTIQEVENWLYDKSQSPIADNEKYRIVRATNDFKFNTVKVIKDIVLL